MSEPTDAPIDPAAEPTPEDYEAIEQEMAEGDPQSEDSLDAEHQDDDLAKARKQSARYRERLRTVEAERDELRGQLDAQRRSVIDWRASTTHGGIDPTLLDAAGLDVDALLDANGNLDVALVDAFVAATAKRFRVAQGFTVNRAQGASGTTAEPQPSLADAFRR